ncbi:MAG: hypothetical protein ACD_41C00268G0004 [uncultured bacterium]|nr:MAG: hypothetical protein ACD_41C00268G0004 [uncultured bacterium]
MPKLLILAISGLVWPLFMFASTAGTIRVTAEQDGQPINTLTDDGATVIRQVQYIGIDAWDKPVATEIRFSGESATPAAMVLVTIPDAKISQTTVVADSGSWTTAVPTVALPAGNYYAYVAIAEGVTFSNSIPAAYFTVLDDQSLSWQTWVFLGTSLLTIVALLSAITLQLGYNSKYHPVL